MRNWKIYLLKTVQLFLFIYFYKYIIICGLGLLCSVYWSVYSKLHPQLVLWSSIDPSTGSNEHGSVIYRPKTKTSFQFAPIPIYESLYILYHNLTYEWTYTYITHGLKGFAPNWWHVLFNFGLIMLFGVGRFFFKVGWFIIRTENTTREALDELVPLGPSTTYIVYCNYTWYCNTSDKRVVLNIEKICENHPKKDKIIMCARHFWIFLSKTHKVEALATILKNNGSTHLGFEITSDPKYIAHQTSASKADIANNYNNASMLDYYMGWGKPSRLLFTPFSKFQTYTITSKTTNIAHILWHEPQYYHLVYFAPNIRAHIIKISAEKKLFEATLDSLGAVEEKQLLISLFNTELAQDQQTVFYELKKSAKNAWF